jgi:hypothetical protein
LPLQLVGWGNLGSNHLPLVTKVRMEMRASRIRKTRWAFHKADWPKFTEASETLFKQHVGDVGLERMAKHFSSTIIQAVIPHIPRGARADDKPWAVDPELV